MIKHIVMWKFKDEVAEADKLEMKRQLMALKGAIPALTEIEVGLDLSCKEASMDMVLHTEFHNLEDLKIYAAHPAHLKVVGFVKPLVCDRAVVDYDDHSHLEKSNMVLIGMPGSGKSTVGVMLAKWLSMGFIDTDLLVQARIGESMQAFQDSNGMEAYRALECDVAESLVCANCVIATGGSVVYFEAAMRHLKSVGQVIFLDIPLDETMARIGCINERGVVIEEGMTMEDLYADRHPLYVKYADIVIDCSSKSHKDVMSEIRALV